MFIDVSVILAGAKSSVFLFDEKEGGSLERVGGMDFSQGEVFIKEVFGGFLFFGGEVIYLPDFRREGVIKVDFVVIGARRGNVVSGLLGEHGGERRVFWGERGFGFGFLSGGSEFSGSGQFGDDWGSCWDKVRATSDDLINGAILLSTGDIFVLSFPVVVHEEVLVSDSVNIDMSWGFDGGSDEVGFMSFGVDREGAEEFLGLVKGFLDGEGFLDPVNLGVEFL